VAVARWEDLERQAPELAGHGRRLLYQFGLGLGFLATIRPDGGPRLHPFCPIVADGTRPRPSGGLSVGFAEAGWSGN